MIHQAAAIGLFIAAFACVNLLTPIIAWVALQRRLFTPVNERSSHLSSIPPFGGASFYFVIVVFVAFLQATLNEPFGSPFIASIAILFMVGIKDDLVHSSVKAKLIGQVVASLIIVYSLPLSITGQGSIGAVCLLILLINAYNLIDGIDGLAGMIGIIACSTYGFLFYQNNDLFFFLLSSITTGMLAAFLRFNLASNQFKIFMGDCGSLVIGLVIGTLTLRFLAPPANITCALPDIEDRFILICTILFIPLFDTFRIIAIRASKKQSPFKADKNHLHHALIDRGFTHFQASLYLSAVQISVLFIHFLEVEKVTVVYIYTGVIFLCFITTKITRFLRADS